jgi:hypothetical protein
MPILTLEQRLAYINRLTSSLPSSVTFSKSSTLSEIVKKRSLATNAQRAKLYR